MPGRSLLVSVLNGALQELLAPHLSSGTAPEDSPIWCAFISSRESEFSNTRKEIEEHLRSQRFESFLAEAVELSPRAATLATSRIKKVEQVLAEAILSSDLFVLLAGTQYGDPPAWGENISATEWEFQTAKPLTKRQFLYKYPPLGSSAILMIVDMGRQPIEPREKEFISRLRRYFCIFADLQCAASKIQELAKGVRQDLIWFNLAWLCASALLLLGLSVCLIYAVLRVPLLSIAVWASWSLSVLNFLASLISNRPKIKGT